MTRSRIIAFAAAGLLAAGLAACTPAETSTAVAGINAACAAAAVGTTVYVQVESSSGGATAQNISKQVSGDVTQDCPVVAAAAQAAINSITAAGDTATVSVSTASPKSAKRKLVAKVRFRAVAGQVEATYVVKPDIVLPLLGAL